MCKTQLRGWKGSEEQLRGVTGCLLPLSPLPAAMSPQGAPLLGRDRQLFMRSQGSPVLGLPQAPASLRLQVAALRSTDAPYFLSDKLSVMLNKTFHSPWPRRSWAACLCPSGAGVQGTDQHLMRKSLRLAALDMQVRPKLKQSQAKQNKVRRDSCA